MCMIQIADKDEDPCLLARLAECHGPFSGCAVLDQNGEHFWTKFFVDIVRRVDHGFTGLTVSRTLTGLNFHPCRLDLSFMALHQSAACRLVMNNRARVGSPAQKVFCISSGEKAQSDPSIMPSLSFLP